MTYCIAMKLDQGLVCLSDTRTNSGMDNIAQFKKMFTWSAPEERGLVILTSGNLSITQNVIANLEQAIFNNDPNTLTLMNCESMFAAAQLVAGEMLKVHNTYGPSLIAAGEQAGATVLLGGQILGGGVRGGKIRLFQIYTTGNFIEASEDSPFFQLGEHKYGKPILDLMINTKTNLKTARLVGLLSMNSTIRSNLSVGEPIDLTILPSDHFAFTDSERITKTNTEYQKISSGWSDALKEAVNDLSQQITNIDSPNQQQQVQQQQSSDQSQPMQSW